MRNRVKYILAILLVAVAPHIVWADEPEPVAEVLPKVRIFGNVYGGGELAQVTEPNTDSVTNHIIQDADLADLFTTHADHVYTTYVHLGENAEVFGRVFGGGKGDEDSFDGEGVRTENPAGKVIGQTDVALDGATVWSEIYGGGEMADVYGNTLVHFKKGKAGHNAYGGGLGKLTENKEGGKLLPDNRQTVLASADIKQVDGVTTKITGESFVVFDGKEEIVGGDTVATYAHYEFETAKTFTIVDGAPVVQVTNQFNPADPEKLFSIDHNIYGGGMTASKVASKSFVHINYGMVNEEMMNFEHEGQKVWSMIYNSIANAQFCVFGGGYGYHTDIMGDANVTMDVQGDGQYKYINEFTEWFAGPGKDKYHWDTNTGSPEAIYAAADEATWSHGAPGRSCMDIIGGGYNGKVLGSTNVIVGGDVVLRKVYGGGYYSSVGHTNVTIKSGIFNRVYGGGLIGNVYGKANLTLGQQGGDEVHDENLHLLVKDAVYGGNDVSGTVGTSAPTQVTAANGVTYNTYTPVDDDDHGVRLNMYGGLVLGDVYGAGNGNHPGYGNPNYMQFGHSQHPSENYRKVIVEGQTEMTNDSYALVYKYRPRTGRVVMNLQGNAGVDFNDEPLVDKVRIWGRTFGGGNSCNVGIWDGTKDDNTEVYSDDDNTSWHPGDNFQGGGTISINVGDHVQLGNRNDSHTTPNGLFMGSNGEHMITQHLDVEKARYYHQYYDMKAKKYYPGFVVYEDDAVTPISRSAGLKAFTAFINNILTKTDNVHLNVKNLDGVTEVQDVWMSNFVGGGYRGSMQAKTATGQFRYELPQGVTIGHSAVGGAFNAHIIYRVYATDYGKGTYKTDAKGNYLYETQEPEGGVISKAEAEAIDIAAGNPIGTTPYDYIRKLYDEDGHLTGYLRYNFDGGILAHDSEQNAASTGSRIHQIHDPASLTTADFTSDGGYVDNQTKALLYLKLQNQLHPIVNEATDSTVLNVHGGIVYGGCFLTGFVDGDTWLEYDCSLSPLCKDRRFFAQDNDSIYGEVADMVRNNALNIFGAGYGEDTHTMGDVYLHINSQGINSRYPFIYNAFGGSNLGTVAGSTNVYYNGGQQGTMLGSLYGGGYKGDIGGNTYVELVQGFMVNVYGGSRQADIGGASHVWAYDGSTRAKTGIKSFCPLIICNLYGGNDISGTISGTMPATWTKNVWTELEGKSFNSYIQVAGTNPGEKGFPLVGSVYGGGNGEQWADSLGAAPDVRRALLEIDGGTTLRAFGGGNKATVTDSVYIFTNAGTDKFADVTFTEYLKHVLEHKFFSGTLSGYTWDGLHLKMDSCHAVRLFGGNNVAEMNIQPMWNLKDGKLGSVYAGGNLGNMTCPDGLSIHVESDTVEIDNLFGGCRMADVQAIRYNKDGEGHVTSKDTLDFAENQYGATANVSAGRVHNVYGGNDVAGHVYNGTNVNITGGIIDNVYGAGNGDYIYQYNTGNDAPAEAGHLVEKMYGDNEYIYYTFRGTKKGASAMEKLQAINTIRPNVDKAYLYIQGTESSPVMLTGSVYCGGNATTVCGDGAYTKLDIGSYCTLDGVYMGSNGEQMTDTTALDHLCQVNSMNLNTMGLLREYMSAVAMPALPRGFALSDTITHTYIGTFCLGGNRGSMTSDQPVHIALPQSLIIYNKVVGGCNQAYLGYGGYTTTGGFTTYNHDTLRTLPKIRLDIRSKFVPMKLNKETLTWDETIEDGMLNDKYCNVYGGCYTRGYIYGDVEINMYSDMVGTFDQDVLENNIEYNETHGRPVFSIFGGGYGANTVIYGNTHIRLLNNHNTIGTPARDALPALKHPSVNAIYGGGEQGKMIGTSTIHIADGTVYSNVVGGALNGSIYGNTEILVGYPSYYEVQKTGEYLLKRSNFTETELGYVDGNGNKAVKQSIFLTKGDRINAAVHQAIVDWDTEKGTHQTDALVLTQNKVQKDWDSIAITIKGGIYGGGYARENVEDGQTAMDNTVLKFTGTYNLATAHPELWTAENTLGGQAIDMQGEYEYGGNATIWVQDAINAQNFTSFDKQKKEHITISTDVETDDEHGIHTGKGGIFGDGHSSLVAAFRSAAVEGYGYAKHPANAPKLLNTFQRFDILQIRDCAMKMYGQIDVATGQNDPTLYSVSRISELMLNSNINADTQDLLATSNLNSRNVIDFYNPVHYLGSITSDVNFKQGSTGSKYHNISGIRADSSYYDYKTYQVSQNYDYQANGISAVSGCKEQFARRNAGTAKNMIRIDDPEGRGVHLKVVQENNYAVNGQGVREEQSFYGPLSGVFEFELTHANARGGGYVYSNNLHQQTIAQSQAKYPGTKTDTESFLQTSGNVFFVPVHLQGSAKDRYVYDDCYPIPYSDRGTGKLEKAHYWFVEGDGPTWCSYPNKPEIIDEANTTIHIRTAEELAWVYDYIDHGYDSNKTEGKGDNDKYPAGFAGWKIVLDNDLDLEQLTILDQREVRMIWCPIADQKDMYFKGTFDGNGHKIDGMLLDVDFITTLSTYGINQNYADGYDHYFGLFAKTKNAVVQNVELSAALVRNSGGNENEMVHIGTLITQVDGSTVVNCSVELTDTILTDKTNEIEAAAAFICHTTGDSSYIARNFVSGTMEANATHVTAPISGFISRLDNGSKMEHCYSLVDVHAQQVAGLADTVQGGAFLEHSYYAGKLTRTDADTPWGAIVANVGAVANIKHCYYDNTKNQTVGGYHDADTQVFKQDDGYTNWSTYGLSTQEMTADQSGTPYKVWRSCYGHDHTRDGETHPCEIDGDSQEFQAHTTAWNKGVWTYLPGLYPILKAQELDCSALTTAFVMPTASSFDMTTHTDLVDEHEHERWFFINKNFQLPAYGTMNWSVANNTLLLDSVSNKAQNKVNAHLYLGGPDVLSINCDDYHRQMQDIYVTREDINNPADIAWYDTLSTGAKNMMAEQLYVANFVPGMLRNKEVTNISKKNSSGKYLENGFDGDLRIWNREGDAGTVTNPRSYTVNGTITYYTGYTNPYLWHEVNIPYEVANTTVCRSKAGTEYSISARTSDIEETADGGNFWLRSFADDAEIMYGGSVFQQGWKDPADGEDIGHRPSVLRFPKMMKVGDTEYLAGDYWCYNQENNIDGEDYHNGGSEIRFYSTRGNTVYGTRDWEGSEDKRGANNIYSFRVYGNPTLGNIQLEGYYWILEGEKRDTTGVGDSHVKPEFETNVAQWFSLQQDPVIKPLGIWIDGPENFKQQALDEGTTAAPMRLRLSPLHEPVVNEQYAEQEASFTASGRNGLLGVFSYIDQDISIYDLYGHLVYSTFVKANTGFTTQLNSNLFVVRGANSPRQVKVLL